jgi:hypothetical protein
LPLLLFEGDDLGDARGVEQMKFIIFPIASIRVRLTGSIQIRHTSPFIAGAIGPMKSRVIAISAMERLGYLSDRGGIR